MALKTFRPTSPGLRHVIVVQRGELWKGKPVKVLTEGQSRSGGRNNSGRITSRHIGGGHKQLYRKVDFKRRKFGVAGTVERLEYDPDRLYHPQRGNEAGQGRSDRALGGHVRATRRP
jgi:large subunit ribosomal protein L2